MKNCYNCVHWRTSHSCGVKGCECRHVTKFTVCPQCVHYKNDRIDAVACINCLNHSNFDSGYSCARCKKFNTISCGNCDPVTRNNYVPNIDYKSFVNKPYCKVGEYGDNDVIATEALFKSLIKPALVIENVIFNDPATIVFWNDGSKTVVKAQNGEPFDREKGLAMAICKKMLGNQGRYYDVFRKWIPEEEEGVIDPATAFGNLAVAIAVLGQTSKKED